MQLRCCIVLILHLHRSWQISSFLARNVKTHKTCIQSSCLCQQHYCAAHNNASCSTPRAAVHPQGTPGCSAVPRFPAKQRCPRRRVRDTHSTAKPSKPLAACHSRHPAAHMLFACVPPCALSSDAEGELKLWHLPSQRATASIRAHESTSGILQVACPASRPWVIRYVPARLHCRITHTPDQNYCSQLLQAHQAISYSLCDSQVVSIHWWLLLCCCAAAKGVMVWSSAGSCSPAAA
jgi:hypothetical protein